jgi:hypothetical protein
VTRIVTSISIAALIASGATIRPRKGLSSTLLIFGILAMCVPVAGNSGMVVIAKAASMGILTKEATVLDAGTSYILHLLRLPFLNLFVLRKHRLTLAIAAFVFFLCC